MKIDTNLRLKPQTHTNTNLRIDKNAILRPNTKVPPKPPEIKIPKPNNKTKYQSYVDFLKAYERLFTGKGQSENEKENQKLSLAKTPINLLSSTDKIIRTCIFKRLKAELFYDGGERVVEIYCYGQNSSGHDVIRVFQTAGFSQSQNPNGFKTFLVSKVRNLNPLYKERFLARPGYKRYDAEMSKIYLQL